MLDILKIAGEKIYPGERRILELPVARLYDFTEMKIPVEIIRGEQKGPVLLVCAAVHGDEVNGVEAIRRLLKSASLNALTGTLIAVPIVNVYGFNNKSRYLPDRRDLNRCFPGSQNGSLGARLAYTFMKEIVSKCTHVLDIHTGSIHRSNLPQVRGCFEKSKVVYDMARFFGAKVALNSNLRDGSLRQAANEKGIPLLLFEGGEALRFEEKVIRDCLRGILGLMKGLNMTSDNHVSPRENSDIYIAKKSIWIRSPLSGIVSMKKKLGVIVKKGDMLATISGPYAKRDEYITSPYEGIVIGQSLLPLATAGDALFHIGIRKGVRRSPNTPDMDFFERDY